MSDLNNVSFTGRLTRDALYKDISTGLAEFSIAINGYKETDTLFLRVNLWGKSAKALMPYLLKGQQIGASGSLKKSEYTGRDGVDHEDFIINCNSLTLLGSKKPAKDDEEEDVLF